MLIKQTAIYFLANIFSAAFGFVNVVVFTRAFAIDAFGDYLLGLAFATLYSTIVATGVKQMILRDQSRGDGTDVRGVALAALIFSLAAAPFGYAGARMLGFAPNFASASVALGIAFVLADATLEVLRAQQEAGYFMRATITRATMVSVFGVLCALCMTSGAALLYSSCLAYLLTAASLFNVAWRGVRPHFGWRQIYELMRSGAPLTLSLTLLALAGMTDRYLLARLDGSAAAGQFGASFDLVRQALILPAVSVASAFVPMTVQINANQGKTAAVGHLARCFELLMAVVLPACIGLALVSSPVADLVLGPDLREVAHRAMPVLCFSVVFQIVTQQYLHISFLLSNRNVFYLVNTASTLAFNIVVGLVAIHYWGVMGAVWTRLVTEIFGSVVAAALTRYAYEIPAPLGRLTRVVIAVAAMAFAVAYALGPEPTPVSLLYVIPLGVVAYAAAAQALDVAGCRAAARERVNMQTLALALQGDEPVWRSLWRALKI